ncbi:MAG: sulfatase-like hydrolase/transferase [Myxococcales bacterium]|nr:sulfatase-like hydrolase/transferase [Myxococcales bacterium]
MSSSPARVPTAWILTAHVLGAVAIGALEAARLKSGALALTLLPLFGAAGLAAGLAIAGSERVAEGKRTLVAAAIRSAPSLIVVGPVAWTLFDGAFARTLPGARLLPFVVPLVAWALIAAVLVGVRAFLATSDLTTRAIRILACAGAIGGIVWSERHLLGSGYPAAHYGATIAVIVLAGALVRAIAVPPVSSYVAAALAACTFGTAVAATVHGLRDESQRRVLETYGDQGRDLVHLVRAAVDLDGDGSSPLLGGGDCDDRDPVRYRGAPDVPGDGIDQDCNGSDAVAPPPPPAPKALDLASWRATQPVTDALARTKGMNVVLVTVDALRFDMLAPDTADRTEFPELVKLLDDSVWFTRAISPATGTDISLGTLLTGRHDPYQTIDTTLPEALQARGYRTYSALPEEVTRYVGQVLPGRGIDRAKPVYTDWGVSDVADHVSAPTTTAEGLRALDDAAGRPSLVWLHYFDVHEHHQLKAPKALLQRVHEEESKKRRNYRALLAAIDHEIGRLRRELSRRGLADKTIIVFAADHGESLGEDPRLLETHGRVAYHALVRIPLAFHIPGVPGGVRTDPASLVDIAPTLLSVLGATGAIAPLDGVDLTPALLGAPPALRRTERALVVQEELQWSVVEWPHQLLVRPSEDLVELYDLEADPAQSYDLAQAKPDVVTRLRARYAEVPQLKVDRTLDGRRWREQQARRPPRRAPAAGEAGTPTP